MSSSRLSAEFQDRDLASLTPDDILAFLSELTDGKKQSTKRIRYPHLTAFFNFIITAVDPTFRNPCDTPILNKLFKAPKLVQWTILEKDVVDEVIFRTIKPRNRLILELMARGGMRISEVLNLTPSDVVDRRLILRQSKSGREEPVYISRKLAERLKGYVKRKEIEPDKRIFPISYSAARLIVKKAGDLIGIRVRPHDLRRHAATYASRSGTPLEIMSKVILRPVNLATTQRHLGKVSDIEAMRWIDSLHG
jgi:integrase/recombinase XerD